MLRRTDGAVPGVGPVLLDQGKEKGYGVAPRYIYTPGEEKTIGERRKPIRLFPRERRGKYRPYQGDLGK